MPSKNTAIIVLVLCLLASLGACLAVYFTNVACGWGLGTWAGTDCPEAEDEAVISSSVPAPAPAPATLTPLQTLKASGQEIQKNELVISGATPPVVATQPTGITATGSFTLSMDLNMTTLPGAGQWLGVFGQGAHPKSPGLWLAAAGLTTTWLRFHVGGSGTDYPGTTPVPYNTYFNVTAVYNAATHTCTLYHNGVKIAENTTIDPTLFTPPTPTNFEWNQQKVTAPTVKVRNVYWWNKALTATEVALLAPPSSGTSTYAAEPTRLELEGFTW